MEQKEKKHISANILRLSENLSYNAHLISYLEQQGHIDRSDVEPLDATFRNEGNCKAVVQLLHLLMGRQKSYVTLVEAARYLCQTGAVTILESLDGFAGSTQLTGTFRKYSRLPTELDAFINKKTGNLSVCICTTPDIPITCEKLRENIEGCSILKYDEFLRIISESSPTTSPLYIVDIPNLHHIKDLLTDLKKFSKNKKKGLRVLLVTGCENENDFRNYITEQKSLKKIVKFFRDTVTWDDLTPLHKHDIKRKLEEHYSFLFDSEELAKALNGQMLIDLINGNKGVKIFRETLPEELSYYIGRRLLTRTYISTKIFEQSALDIFVIAGVEQHALSGMAKAKMTDTSSNQIRQTRLTVEFILLENPSHYDKICKMTTDPIHWLQYEGGRLKWIKSRGKISTLQACIANEQDQLDEENFCESLKVGSNLPICISDSPGMGKSVLLAQIGRRLINLHPERKVFFLVLSEFVNLVNKNDKNALIIKILKRALGRNLIGEVILKSLLTSDDGIAMELLFDGLDEVDINDLQLVYEVLQELASFKSIRLWVTTRSHLLRDLEYHLNTLGYNIKPFNEDDQVRFLKLYWMRNKDVDDTKSEQFARECLKILKSRMQRTSDHDIAGIPLQCLLIGDVYEEDALADCTDPETSTVPLILFNSITDLYKYLVTKKLQKYLSVHVKEDFGGIDALLDMHARLSMELIFPEQVPKLENLLGKVDMKEMLKIGILEVSSNVTTPRFLHRTFAEYFVAWFVMDKLTNGSWTADLNELFFEGMLGCNINDVILYTQERKKTKSFQFVQPVITYFLNDLLRNPDVQHSLPWIQIQPQPFQDFLETTCFKDKILQQVLHASANSDFIEIFSLFNGTTQLTKQSKGIFNDEFVLLIIAKSSLELVKLAFNHLEEDHISESSFQSIALREAVHRGEFSIVEYLLKELQWNGIVEELNEGTKSLVIDCVYGSRGNSELIINQKIQVLRRLIDINGKLVGQQDDLGGTPLLSRGIHVKLFIELVKLGGVDMDALDDEGKSFFQLALARNTLPNKDLHSLLTHIPEEKLKVMFQKQTGLGETPLMSLLRFDWFKPLPETLKLFQRLDADFNHVNRYGDSVLVLATKTRLGVGTFKRLIDCGANVSWKGRKSETLLHVAAMTGNLPVLEYLLDDLAFEVNAEDEDGLTSLDYAMRSQYAACLEPGIVLQRRGGRFKGIVNSENQSWLHVAAKEGFMYSIPLVIRLGVDVNGRDVQGNTPLHLAITNHKSLKPYWRIVNLLLNANADPNLTNSKGETPLQASLTNSRVGLDIYLLLKSKTNMKWTPFYASLALCLVIRTGMELNDEEFNSLANDFVKNEGSVDYVPENSFPILHLAIDCRHKRAVEFLMNNGANVNVINKWQETALKIATEKRDNEGGWETLKYLISRGADINARNKRNQTFLHEFSSLPSLLRPSPSEYHSMVEYLLGEGLSHLFSVKGAKFGETPFQLSVQYLELEEGTLQLLHSNNVDFNLADDKGNTVLQYAIMGARSTELLSNLIKFGADWKALRNHGYNVLHTCTHHGSLASLKFFLNLGEIDVNAGDDDGDTPLHIAVLEMKPKRILAQCKLLIENGADVGMLNNAGYDPLTIVMEKYNGPDKEELIKLLVAGWPESK